MSSTIPDYSFPTYPIMSLSFFSIQAADGRKYPRADSFGPLPEMPFFEGMDSFLKSMEQYWEVNPEAPGMEIAPVGTEWSDLVLCCNSPPSFFVSQRFIDSLEREGIPIYRKTEMPIAKIKSKRLKEVKPPIYYVAEAIPGLAVDWAAMGIKSDFDDRPLLTDAQRMNLPSIVFDESSWNGLDLFSLFNRGSTLSLYCTERVKQLASDQKWTNVNFVPIG